MPRIDLGIAPRSQWEGNFGYCGEVSFISAGLYYGQYVSLLMLVAAFDRQRHGHAHRPRRPHRRRQRSSANERRR